MLAYVQGHAVRNGPLCGRAAGRQWSPGLDHEFPSYSIPQAVGQTIPLVVLPYLLEERLSLDPVKLCLLQAAAQPLARPTFHGLVAPDS